MLLTSGCRSGQVAAKLVGVNLRRSKSTSCFIAAFFCDRPSDVTTPSGILQGPKEHLIGFDRRDVPAWQTPLTAPPSRPCIVQVTRMARHDTDQHTQVQRIMLGGAK